MARFLPSPAALVSFFLFALTQLSKNSHGNSIGEKQYGVDVAFPHQSLSRFESKDNPHGSTAQDRYEEFLRGCREAYPDIAHRCSEGERSRIWQNLKQPQVCGNLTDTGYEKRRCPPEVYDLLRNFFEKNQGKEEKEEWPAGNIFTNHWISPTYILDVKQQNLEGGGLQVADRIREVIGAIVEEWVGEPLKPVSLFGPRLYKDGSVLSPHVDRHPLVSSAIINVAQDVDEDWPLEVIDRQGISRNITMQPGDMVLYESHSLIHGRPFPLIGRYYANVFVHFEPLIYNEPCYDDTVDCKGWADSGECTANPGYMNRSCKESCHLCPVKEKNKGTDEL